MYSFAYCKKQLKRIYEKYLIYQIFFVSV